MRWQLGRRSDNVEDQRDGGGGGMVGPIAGGGIGTVIVALLISFIFGVDPSVVLQNVVSNQPPTASYSTPANSGPDQELTKFVSVVLADTEDTWQEIFQTLGSRYVEPKLVLFSDQVSSACGFAQAASGPFYCPADQKVYIDLAFYRELQQKFRAPGDFAQAYVIAHEIGHHVQNLLGISDKVESMQRRVGEVERNQLSVRLELQADCLAGIWANNAHRTRNILEAGDVEEALNAASSIGDDNLQRQARGYVVPESFTHGSAAQRVRWFNRGIESGDLNQCDTFSSAKV
jgi:uncharacterized protein